VAGRSLITRVLARRRSRTRRGTRPGCGSWRGSRCRSSGWRSGGCGTNCRCWRGCRATLRAVSPASIEIIVQICATPNDHVSTGPDARVILPTSRCISRVGCRPAVHSGIVSATCVEIFILVRSTPDDHFISIPNCGVTIAAIWSVCGGGR
jgi:hypothetical protein